MSCAVETMTEFRTFAPESLQTSRRLISRIYGRRSACWCWQAGPFGRWICLGERTPDREICEYAVTKIPLIWLQWAQRPWSNIIPPPTPLELHVACRARIRSGRGQNKRRSSCLEQIHFTTVIFSICKIPHPSALNLISAESVQRCPSSSLQACPATSNVRCRCSRCSYSQWQPFQTLIGNVNTQVCHPHPPPLPFWDKCSHAHTCAVFLTYVYSSFRPSTRPNLLEVNVDQMTCCHIFALLVAKPRSTSPLTLTCRRLTK